MSGAGEPQPAAPTPDPAAHSPPGLAGALALSGLAWLVAVMAAVPLFGWASPPTALAVGAVVGFGGLGTLVARQLPPPVDRRLGLRGFRAGLLGVLALLVPAAILASELDNLVRGLLAAAEPVADPVGEGAAQPGAGPTGWLVLEGAIVMVLLRPVVEEFFFRGVLLQGLVSHYGRAAGVALAALLSGACEAAFLLPSGVLFASAAVQGVFLGTLLGGVRIASGSLLAPILLLGALRGSGGLAVAFREELPIPGFNAPGEHTPGAFLLPALACVTVGVWRLRRAWHADEDALKTPERGCPDPEE